MLTTSTILTTIILYSIATENLSEFFVKDEVTLGLRVFLFKKRKRLSRVFNFIGDIFTCGRCMSGWVSLIISAYFYLYRLEYNLLAFIVSWQAVWYLSNIFHHLRDRINCNYHKEE